MKSERRTQSTHDTMALRLPVDLFERLDRYVADAQGAARDFPLRDRNRTAVIGAILEDRLDDYEARR
jgi:hypothetical protein